jgi:hypothetical protein
VCETDDGTAPSAVAEILGLAPPPYFHSGTTGGTAGTRTRFPLNVTTAYAITYVYGDRGESGPSPVQPYQTTLGLDEIGFTRLPVGPSGVTKKRIYRSQIGHADNPFVSAAAIDKVSTKALYLLDEIPNATQTYTDAKDDSQLDYSQSMPPPRPFPPISKYQVFHLDRIFMSNVRDHPYTMQFVADPGDAAPLLVDASGTITISNAGNGTITVTHVNTTPTTITTTVNNYKTKTLSAIRAEIMTGFSLALGFNMTTSGVICRIAPGLDDTRTYTFKEVTAQSIFGAANAYWAVAIDDTATMGMRWFPNRTFFTEIAFPEQVDFFNTFDITTGGSKKITGAVHSELDGSLVLFTEDKPFIVSGDFVPAIDTGVPVFRIDPAIANVGNICYRPDAVCATDIGIFYVGYDGLRLFRGEKSVPAGREVQNWFKRLLREPVCRDNLSMNYHGGLLRIALPTEETA